MLSVPAALADIGVDQELKAALLKMSASLPAMRRHDEELVRQRFYIDSTWWRQGGEHVPHLQSIHKAVWENRQIRIKYRPPFAIELEQAVAPYGLVAKAGVWYVVYARKGKVSSHRVSDLIDVQVLDKTFERPVSFDLAEFWADWCAGHESLFTSFSTTVRVAPNFLPILPRYFGAQIQEKVTRAGTPDGKGWIKLELSFETFEAARERILGFGRGVEVLKPMALRRSVLDMAEQIVDLYRDESV